MSSLAGLKVIDLSRVLGGPYCTQILGDHGADVLKIEPPQGDETRTWGPPFDSDGAASYFIGINRNKRGAVMDLTDPAAREVLLGLLEGADVLVENFKAGTMEKWGLGFEVLHQRFPKLVYARVTGFGADGPMGGLPGYDAAVQALTGMMSVNGEAGGEPLRMGVPMIDIATGLNMTIGIMLALHERSKSGLGQFVESALYDCGLASLHSHSANYLMDGRLTKRAGNAHPNITPYDTFATKTDPIFLAVGNDKQFATLCRVIGDADLAKDERYLDNKSRTKHRPELKAQLEALMGKLECAPLADELIRAGVPCAPILDLHQALNAPHTQHRKMVVEMDDGQGDVYKGIASPIKLSRTPATYRLKPPKFKSQKQQDTEKSYETRKAIGSRAQGQALLERIDQHFKTPSN